MDISTIATGFAMHLTQQTQLGLIKFVKPSLNLPVLPVLVNLIQLLISWIPLITQSNLQKTQTITLPEYFSWIDTTVTATGSLISYIQKLRFKPMLIKLKLSLS